MKKTAILFFALLIFAPFWKGTAQVPIGGGTTTQRFPFGNHYGFESSSAIYTATEIGFTGTITGMAWYADVGGKGSRPIKVYLKKTTNNVFPLPVGPWTLQIAGAVLVYEGNLTPIAGWNTLTFDVPFVYDQNNLMVMVEANYGGNGNGGGTIGNAIRYSDTYLTHAYWFENNSPSIKSGTASSNRPNIRIDFTPPIPTCIGIPDGGVASVTPTSGEHQTAIIMSAIGHENRFGTSFQWQHRNNDGPWQQLGTLSTIYADANTIIEGDPGDQIEVRLKVYCINSDETSYSTSAFFEVIPPTSYCIPTYEYAETFLSEVYSEGALTDVYYSVDYPPADGNAIETDLPFVAHQGLNFTMFTTYDVRPSATKIWVDWNRDFFFSSDEGLALEYGPEFEKTLSLTIPTNVTPGDYRMRVRAAFSNTFIDPHPCDYYYYGSAVDFTITVLASRSCLYPEEFTVTNITETSADFSWTPINGETAWNLIYGEIGFDPLTQGTTIRVNNLPQHQLTGLPLNTGYDVYLRSICGTNDESFLTSLVSFRTGCGSTSVPYFLDFEDTIEPMIPYCTFQENNGAGKDWATVEYPYYGYDGNVLISEVHFNIGRANSWFFTQGIEMQADKVYRISFLSGSPAGTQSLKLAYGTSPSEVSMTNPLIDFPSMINRQSMVNEFNFTVAEDGVYYFGFNVYSQSAQGSMLVDNILIDEVQFSGYVFKDNVWTPEDPSGIATQADNITVVNGTTTLSANTQAKNLTIVHGATLLIDHIIGVRRELNIYGDLIFKSNENGNGELDFVFDDLIIRGEATVERYMSNNRAYRMVSSSVTTSTSIHDNWQEGATSNTDNPAPGFGTHITGSTIDQQNGFDKTGTGNPSMFTVDTGSQSFVAISNTDVNNFFGGHAYLLFVRGDRSINLNSNSSSGETVLRAKGKLLRGLQPRSFLMEADQFAMIGNPYQSAVDVNSLLQASPNAKTDQFYIYDPNLGDQGAYVTIALPAGTNTSGSAANKFLQPGQGAQISGLANGFVYVRFNEVNKAPGNFTSSNAMDNRMFSDNMLTVQLYTTENYNNGGRTHDSFGIIFADGLDNEITPADAVKPMNFYENLGINHNGKYLSLEHREMPATSEVYSLYSSGYTHSDYTLKIIIDGLENTFLYLNDTFTGISTLLEGGENAYSFSVDANDALSIATDRFFIKTEARLGVDNDNLLTGVQLSPNPLLDNTFYINAPKLNGEQISVSICDISGRQIFKNMLDCRDNTVTVSVKEDLAAGVYIVTLSHGSEERSYKLIKR